ncbi:hypothetical protein C8Q80DRAFT_606951 [Daedaleopsis nitida]|nr:hypothetical protein C8Q80DRAFT_606951 [Daedaleopsis nitida]
MFDYDVLHHIMELCDRKEASKLMRTCKLLYREGARPLLRKGVVDLRHEGNILSFTFFLLADDDRRLATPFGLRFSGGQISPRVADCFCKVIVALSPKLHLLSLHFYNPEDFLCSDTNLPQAFARIATIDEIVLIDADIHSRTLLEHLSGTVGQVHIEFVFDEDDPRFAEDDGDPDDRNPIVLLKSVRQTLTSLSGLWFQTDEDVDAYDIVYPNMRYLEVETFETPNLAHYLPAFPNLASITLTTGASEPDEGQEAFLRARNKSAQALHGRWPKLDRIAGSVVDLWCLGLDCPVDNVNLESYPWDTLKFLDVLADMRPNHLHVGMGGSVLCNMVTLPQFLDAICAIRTLQLEVKFDKNDCELISAEFQDSLVKLVSSSQLTALGLSCGTIMMDFPHERDPNGPISPIEQYLIDLDAEALADLLQARASSLQSVTIRLIAPRDHVKVKTVQRGQLYEYPKRYSTETYSQFSVIRSDDPARDLDFTENNMEEY